MSEDLAHAFRVWLLLTFVFPIFLVYHLHHFLLIDHAVAERVLEQTGFIGKSGVKAASLRLQVHVVSPDYNGALQVAERQLQVAALPGQTLALQGGVSTAVTEVRGVLRVVGD